MSEVTEILRAIADHGYETPTPIQAQAIPTVLSGLRVGVGMSGDVLHFSSGMMVT